MKYLFINSVAGSGSTGRIAADKCRELQKQGHQCVLAYGRWQANCEDIQTYQIGTALDYRLHGLQTRLFDRHGFGSKAATKKFLNWAQEYNPDVIWLHNLHGYYINIELLFNWLKQAGKPVYWTLHDCWAFTGHCSHFDFVGCEQWKNQCRRCPQTRRYPKCWWKGNVRRNFERKKAAFTGVRDMKLIVPSHWLEGRVKQSFLSGYPTEVVYNTIDTSVFRPTPSKFREKYGLQNKKIVLGVASVWEERKGLDDFLKLAAMLDKRYHIVLVGLDEKQLRRLPENILGLARTESLQELAALYSAADVFVNLSVEETFGLTNLEAFSCGTTVFAYRDTACAEFLEAWYAVEKNDLESLVKKIEEVTARNHA